MVQHVPGSRSMGGWGHWWSGTRAAGAEFDGVMIGGAMD